MKTYNVTIDKKELHKNFILIHEFIYPNEPIKGWVRDSEEYTGQYHEDWNSLMEVIKKCESIDSTEIRRCIGNRNLYRADIFKVYEGVVDFINDFNNK